MEASGLYAELQGDGLLVPHTEQPAGDGLELRPERLPFISYPYEWTPRQLRDAALLTLDIADRARRRGMVMRDASAFNIQFHRGRPLLIDSLSFEPRESGAPWLAYGQFCRHFLAPLALATLAEPRLLRLAREHADGIPIPLTTSTLGRRGWLRLGVLVHLHLHAAAERRAVRSAEPPKITRVPDGRLAQTIDGLRSTIEGLPLARAATPWEEYGGGAHYDAASRAEKERFIADAVGEIRPASLWDLGANTGEYAIVHAPANGYALALDADLGSAEAAYAAAKRSGKAVVTLWDDLLAPASPGGWANEERASLIERGPADLVLALALLHHLAIAGRVPLERVVEWLARIARHAVVELPDRDDPMVRRLAGQHRYAGETFGLDVFRRAVQPHFTVVREVTLSGLPRVLFLLRRTGGQDGR